MAYNEFAYFYDELNSEADYDALYRYVTDELAAHGIRDGILADLGCGTGDLTLMLAQAGYDVIGIDRSEEMLSVLREKADELDMTGRILLLRQDLLSLDLYGTIRAAVSPLIPTTISARWISLKKPSAKRPTLWKKTAFSSLT